MSRPSVRTYTVTVPARPKGGRLHQTTSARRRPEVLAGELARMLEARRGAWTGPTMALAMVLIALATIVGVAFTSWHYWKAEERAAAQSRDGREQRQSLFWEREYHRGVSYQQKQREFDLACQQLRLASAPSPIRLAVDNR